MGVWIETFCKKTFGVITLVTPFVGVWIETASSTFAVATRVGHTLRGCVD